MAQESQNYSKMYLGTAILHAVYLVIFLIEGCLPLSLINIGLICCYIYLSAESKQTSNFRFVFMVCTFAMLVFIISHYAILGPSFGFQYLSIGVVPLVYYLGYMHGNSLNMSKRVGIAIYVMFCLAALVCTVIHYPLVSIGGLSKGIIIFINSSCAFFMSINFLNDLINKIYTDNGVLENKNLDLENNANTDALTGLRNRRTINSYIEKFISTAKLDRKFFSVLMLDIDNFKKVNDTYGHDCGDQVLKNIANVITNEIRPDDVVFRWGGEEILVIVNAGHDIAKSVAERCRRAIEESTVEYEDTVISVTVTIGGCAYYQNATYDDLINIADKNLYTGKQSGKNQVVM